jgi:cholesterol oxidase
MKRRKFIKLSSGAAASLLISSGYTIKNRTVTIDIETLIIGSGYGGAVTALRLTQAGKRCTMVEMGLNWNTTGEQYKPFSDMSAPKENSTWLKKKTIAPMLNSTTFPQQFTGMLDRIDYKNIKVYAGRGVGGGSLVNGGMAVTPRREYFEEMFPNLNATDFYSSYFPKAKAQLGVNEINPVLYSNSEFYKFSRVGEYEAQKAGFTTVKVPNVYDFSYMEKEDKNEAQRSAFNKELIYGNNHGKKSLDKTYLKDALQTGLLTILDLHRVDNIKENTDGTFNVCISVIDVSGNTTENKNICCKRLFLCAGSIATTNLLVSAKGKGDLLKLDNSIGQGWGNNGNIMTGRNFVNTVFNHVKPANNKNPGRGTGGNQSTIPVVGIDNWMDETNPFFAEISPFPMGMEVYTALYLLINKVPQMGYFYWNKESGTVELKWDKINWEHALNNAKEFVNRMRKANGGTRSHLLFNNGFGHDICYHPLGGCVLGRSTDNYGRVKGYKNLYAIDGSLVPGTIGVNPFLTITALAEYCIENIIRNDI